MIKVNHTMSIKDLINEWESSARGAVTHDAFCIKLPLEDAARLAALSEMYPRRHIEEIIRDLLHAALDELERSFPYQQGQLVVAEDEEGNPLYEDIGPTPKYLELSRKHLKTFKENLPDTH